MRIAFNPDLINDLAKRRVVLFIGAGVSKWAKPRGGGSFKDWPGFLAHATSKVTDAKLKRLIQKRINARDYLIASELLKLELQDSWPTELTQEFQQAAEISRLHKAIVALDQRIVVTTNFDKLLENAWNEHASQQYPQVISDIDSRAFRMFRDDQTYLVKLHGTVDYPERIVFDKTSYQNSAFANRFYSELLGTLLLTHTFIFIGFSMDDPAVAMVVENHAHRFPDTRPHYVFLPGPAVDPLDELSKRLRKLFVVRYSPKNNHLALAEKVEALASEMANRRVQLLAERAITQRPAAVVNESSQPSGATES